MPRAKVLLRYYVYRVMIYLPQISFLICWIIRGKHQQILKGFEGFREFKAALAYAKFGAYFGVRVCRNKALTYLIRLGKTQELQKWRSRTLASFPTIHQLLKKKTPHTLIAAVFRVEEFLGIGSVWRREFLQKLNAELIHAKQSGLEPADLYPLLRIALWARVLPSSQSKSILAGQILPKKFYSAYAAVHRKCHPISKYVKLAALNEASPPSEWRAINKTNATNVEIFIPPHFFARWDEIGGGKRVQNWTEIRSLYSLLFSHLSRSKEFAVIPRHQFFSLSVPPKSESVGFSFFTKGGAVNNWHIRDLGFAERVSIDPDGFWGVSSLSIAEQGIAEGLSMLELSEEEARSASNTMRVFLATQGGNKYGGDKNEERELTNYQYVFCPLQSPPGLEGRTGTITQLISCLVEFSKQHNVQIVFKRHPLCDSILVDKLLLDARRAGCIVSNVSTWKLVENSKAVVTLNSAVALQAVVARKPLITWGDSDVRAVCRVVDSVVDLKNALMGLDSEWANRYWLYDRFCWWYWNHYLVNLVDEKALFERIRLATSLAVLGSKEEVRTTFIQSLFDRASKELCG